jgi:hypothetical protein
MKYKSLIFDLSIVVLSIFLTFLLAKFGVVLKLENIITSDYILAFVAGIFFISFFTVVPSGYILINLIGNNDLAVIALIAGAGAAIGDSLIFLFVKNKLSHDFFSFLHFRKDSKPDKMLKKIKDSKLLKIFLPVIGAAIIVSPFPDEIGVALMGASRIKKRYFIPISYLLNTIGIYLLLLAAGSIK